MDLNKEIKLSDLFKRRAKPAKPAEPFDETKEPEADGRSAGPQKALRFFALRRRVEEPREPGAPKAPKVRREKSPSPALALSEVPLMRAFNLLPKEDAREARRGRPSTAQLVLAVASLVGLAALGSAFMVLNAGVADKRGSRDELRAQVAALQVAQQGDEGDSEAPVDPAIVQEKNLRTSVVASALGQRIAWDRVLRDLSLVTPEGVWLSGLVATPGAADPSAPAPASESTAASPPAPAPAQPSSITLNGYAYSQEGVARLLARLAVVPGLADVKLLSSARALIGETEVFQFSVSAAVKLPGGASA